MTFDDYTNDELRAKVTGLIRRLAEFSPDDADRFDSALECFWGDRATLLDLIDDLRETIAAERRMSR